MSDTKDFDLQSEGFENKISLLVKAIKDALIARGEMMATAESLTGGLVASSIVNEAGSSAVLAGGIVAYQNEVKEALLGVPHQVLEEKGAVSAETVKAMAEGARKKFGCEWAIATSGIAGPTGAEPGKPVGTVWMAVANSLQNEAFCKIFEGNRTEVRQKSVYSVLGKLLFLLNNQKSTCTSEH
ncbi:CinA family protein [Fibrobacter sp. UWB10]|uniref:CinA family protein n=1 Tax=Fibrobacter sp. UWB10 TaxID=1896201 RepID=UPI00156BB066|nr:CinA family protein [Fibrobacter sp. UWB10]MBO7511779.1 CinA family protein [Fibrobacter sp.]SMP51696.1 nicotinamide-nucleotide amidase [Fibrobacter sp. UWB10]